MLARPTFLSRPLGLYHPSLQPVAVAFRTLERWLEWRVDGHRYAHDRASQPLPHRVKKHTSVLVRRLAGADRSLQLGKVENLRRVVARLDGLLVRPGETFSFCRRVGRPTRRRGFVPGMELSRGEARPGVGGGICQASNLIFWLALHSPLEVVERHHHSFDPFPDDGRILPFASGATVQYPYLDLRLRNPTEHTFQLRLWLDPKCLCGELRCDAVLPLSYSVFERNHRFETCRGVTYRCNELWRLTRLRATGEHLGEEHLFSNRGEVKYALVAGAAHDP